MVDLLVVTGAGASTMFGRDGQRIPMMTEWCQDIRQRLGSHLTRVVGLDVADSDLHNNPNPTPVQIDGPTFERRLGAFLKCVRAMPSVLDYPLLGAQDHTAVEPQVEAWIRHARTNADSVTGHLWASLHELFALSRFDVYATERAWSALFANCPSISVVVATTNYDQSVEAALASMRRRPFSGEDVNLQPGTTSYVDLVGVTRRPRCTPVLYLHGRVGWYETVDREVVVLPPNARYNPDTGTPALLLPELEKNYRGAVVSTLWEQFREALGSSNRVLVLGHSLADDELVDALKVVPRSALGVCWYAPSDPTPDWNDLASAYVYERLGSNEVWLIPMQFGPSPLVRLDRWRGWVDGEPSRGLPLTPGPFQPFPG